MSTVAELYRDMAPAVSRAFNRQRYVWGPLETDGQLFLGSLTDTALLVSVPVIWRKKDEDGCTTPEQVTAFAEELFLNIMESLDTLLLTQPIDFLQTFTVTTLPTAESTRARLEKLKRELESGELTQVPDHYQQDNN